jgi:branched-chain amino acid transport system permease protein
VNRFLAGTPTIVRRAGWAAVLVLAGVATTFVLPAGRIFPFSQFVVYLGAAAGLTVLMGLSGQLSLGHAAFMAVGGYTMAFTQNALYERGFTVAPPAGGSGRFASAAPPVAALWTLPVSLLAGVVAAVLAGALVGLAAARLRGPYLAGVTLTIGIAVPSVTATFAVLGGEQGFAVQVPRRPSWLAADIATEAQWRAWLALVATAIMLAVLANLSRGPLGRDLRAVRDDEVAAALAGIPVARTRVLAFVVSAASAGLAGGLYVYLTGTVLPGYFSFTTSLFLLLAAVLGGLGSLAGAAWGALFVVAVPIATAELVGALHAGPALAQRLAGNLPLALLGLALIVVTLTARRRPRSPGWRAVRSLGRRGQDGRTPSGSLHPSAEDDRKVGAAP